VRLSTIAVGAAIVGSCAVLVRDARAEQAKRTAAIDADLRELPDDMRADVARVLSIARTSDVADLRVIAGHLEVAGFLVASRRVSIVADELHAVGGKQVA
jgi:hypothetical protein